MTNNFLYIALGLFAGCISGVIGIGGGVVIVPALIFLFGMTVHQAQGTSLAVMLPPIGILAAWMYYNQGHVDIKIALLIAAGFIVGGFLGAKLAVSLSSHLLSKIFGAFIIMIGLKMVLS
ncbi:MAG: TSUP family transporter [Gammaproteobacteria bacterium]